jgi:hypothetical protein
MHSRSRARAAGTDSDDARAGATSPSSCIAPGAPNVGGAGITGITTTEDGSAP